MTPTSPILFPPFRLDLVNECVWRERQQIPLRGKTFAVLRCLVEHAGQLVSKEALLNAVWPQTYVSDMVLMVCIRELRRALGDDAKQPQYIETVHRRGYRFIAAVTEQMNEPVVYFEQTEDPPGPLPLLFSPALPEEEHPARLSPSSPSPALAGEGRGEGLAQPSSNDNQLPLQLSSQRPRLRASLLLVGLFLLAGLVVTVQYLSLRPPTPSATIPPEQPPTLPLPDKPSIAVLPFANLSGDPKQEYFGYGMMEDLITDLSKLSGLVVIADYSAFTYKGKAVKVQEVSKELGVRYVLEGSVREIGDHILITAQLVDGTTGRHVWAERYDRPLQDLFAVQEEVRRKILVHLGLKLTPEEEERLQRAYTPNLEAYNDVTHATESFLRLTPADNAQARQLCEKAIALDPSYAVAYALLGFTYWVEWAALWSDDPQALERAFTLAQQALALDDSFPGAHELLGIVYLWRDKQYEQAIAEEKRAIAYSPNWFSAYNTLGGILNLAGRPEETIALAEQALRLSPRSLHYLPILAGAYTLTGRYEEAIATYRKVLAFIPSDPGAHLGLAHIYSELGREEEAQAEAAEFLRLNPNFSLEAVKQRAPFKDPAVLERILAALRKAGLK